MYSITIIKYFFNKPIEEKVKIIIIIRYEGSKQW